MGLSKPIKVSIMGQEYNIRTDADQNYIKKVAKFVEDRMKEIQNAAPDTTSQLRIAVLAAMNVTDEYFTIKRQKNEVVDKLESKTIAMSDFIDKKILEFESV
ncbi:MAG: cell division protein ZapA [Candidatus Neomarinimicrobiota bacterium]|jgi:cell division protein ZapA|nr:cell division protein ZapA [Candidatus Neomarinimicrobiota bacterium]